MEQPSTQEKALFAGGCFWCMEPVFTNIPGVMSVTSGYTGGHVANPTYEQVSTGTTGHAEAVEVVYDPTQISYETLLEHFWKNIDPVDADGQFADRGPQYRTAIFYTTEAQKTQAEASKAAIAQRLGASIRTEITAAGAFYPAEDYHQDYSTKNTVRYNAYKYGSGRVSRLKELWEK